MNVDSCIFMMALHVLFLSMCIGFNIGAVQNTKVIKVGIKGTKGN